MKSALSLVVAGISWLAIPTWTAAQPIVRVRAETRIELAIERQGEEAVVRGALRDDLGAPIAGRAIRVELREAAADGPLRASQEIRTTPTGSFEARFPREEGRAFVVAAFEGGPLYRAHEVVREARLDRAHVRLDVLLEGGARLDLDRPTHRLTVHAISDVGGSDLSVVVLDNQRVLANGVTDQEGEATFELVSADLGPASAGRLVVRSEPDSRRRDAQTEVPIIRYRHTVLTLQSAEDEVAPESSLELTGSLRATSGGLDGHAVGLWAADHHLATSMTGPEGTFRFSIPVRDLSDGTEITARFQSDAPWWGSSTSPPVQVHLAAGSSSPWLGTLLCLVLAALAVMLSGRAKRSGAPPTTERPRAPPPLALGARRSHGPQSTSVQGFVLDRRTESPIRLALMSAESGNGATLAHTTGVDGSFSLELTPGTWALRLSAPGYEQVEQRVTVPHRGEWTGATLRLNSLRDLGWEAMKNPSACLLPSPDAWGVWTARDLEDAAQSRGPAAAAALHELARDVERVCYAPTPPTTADLESVAVRAQEAAKALRRIRA